MSTPQEMSQTQPTVNPLWRDESSTQDSTSLPAAGTVWEMKALQSPSEPQVDDYFSGTIFIQ